MSAATMTSEDLEAGIDAMLKQTITLLHQLEHHEVMFLAEMAVADKVHELFAPHCDQAMPQTASTLPTN